MGVWSRICLKILYLKKGAIPIPCKKKIYAQSLESIKVCELNKACTSSLDSTLDLAKNKQFFLAIALAASDVHCRLQVSLKALAVKRFLIRTLHGQKIVIIGQPFISIAIHTYTFLKIFLFLTKKKLFAANGNTLSANNNSHKKKTVTAAAVHYITGARDPLATTGYLYIRQSCMLNHTVDFLKLKIVEMCSLDVIYGHSNSTKCIARTYYSHGCRCRKKVPISRCNHRLDFTPRAVSSLQLGSCI
ncbi:hypothetical protein QTP88_012678 [Uroleucon formosanum]